MPIIPSHFQTNHFLQNGHTQTLLAKFWPRTTVLNIKRQRLELADGDFIDCDWVGGDGPIVVVLHGLEGSIHSHYIQGILQALSAHNYRAVVMHFRGCSGTPNRLARAYHSGDTQDLAALIAHLKQHHPHTPLYAIGYSLGGNVLLKWLGEEKEAAPLSAAVAVSVPYQLASCVAQLNQGMLKMYQHRFVQQLKLKMAQKISMQQLAHLQHHLEKISTLHEFDDKITAPLHGFKDAIDYYTQSSCYAFLKHVSIPTLLLHAMDDPMIPPHVIPDARDLSQAVTLERSKHGGHVGFIHLDSNLKMQFYLEHRIPEYFNHTRTNNHFK